MNRISHPAFRVSPSPRLPRCPSHSAPRGMTVAEVLIAGMLLGSVMALAVPTLGWVVQQRRAAERRQQATLEVENVLERFTAAGWDEITQENAAQLEPAAAVREQLPEAELRCSVASSPDAAGEKRIHVELAWSNRPGQPAAPVRLTTWVYRGGREE